MREKSIGQIQVLIPSKIAAPFFDLRGLHNFYRILRLFRRDCCSAKWIYTWSTANLTVEKYSP